MADPQNVTLSSKSKVLISAQPNPNPVAFAVVQGTLTFTADKHEVTESEVVPRPAYVAPAKRTTGGNRQMTFNIQFHAKSNLSPHALPGLGLREGGHIYLRVWVHGFNVPTPNDYYEASYALVETVEVVTNPKTGEPVMYTITGDNGLEDYRKPGDTGLP